jgi:transcriptional regulator with XRE-family HTH domain
MLPCCDRLVRAALRHILPVWTRSFPVSKQPQTIGEHLKKKRFDLGLRQSQAAQRLRVSKRTLSLWECDRVYPTWPQQPAVTLYLGYDPFTNPALGSPKCNESSGVAFLPANAPTTVGQQLLRYRLELKKNRQQLARELDISVKTLWGWETGRRQPSLSLRTRIFKVLGFDLRIFY